MTSVNQQPTTKFTGFPAGAKATAIPSSFFTELLPRIDDFDELRVTLFVVYTLGRKRSYPNFVSYDELAASAELMSMFETAGVPHEERLRDALALAVQRGGLLELSLLDAREQPQNVYLLNMPSSRRAIDAIRQGRIDIGMRLAPRQEPPSGRLDNPFALYEANIGPITPLVAQELQEAEQLYPYEWIEEAMGEAAQLNKRSWRYVAAILKRWAVEGRIREEAGRDPGAGNTARAQFLRRFRDLGGE